LALVILSCATCLILAPFARVPLARIPAFIPAYEATLVIIDLITATLLFGQFSIGRAASLLLLACGYVFSGVTTAFHALSFPGAFSDAGLLGGGAQTTAWLYMFWHAGFPLAVIGYALLRYKAADWAQRRPAYSIAGGVIVSVAASVGFTALSTAGETSLPEIMEGSHYTPAMIFVVSTVWCLSLAAILALFSRRPLSVLDLGLTVVQCAWLCDIALSAVLNAGRFDLGFYSGRIFGLAATSLVLLLLVLEIVVLYGRVARSIVAKGKSVTKPSGS